MNGRVASFFVVSILLLTSGAVYVRLVNGDLIDEGSLVLRDEIFIMGNSQFTLENGVVGGSGSENDPYIIENWMMDNARGGRIEIIDTNSHVVIRNCKIWGYPNEGDAVVLRRASNISIQNCLIGNLDEGIKIRENARNIIIQDCTLQDINDGISLNENVNNISILNCTFQKIREGIDLYDGANNITIQDCIMEEMDEGVVILRNSENITIKDCSFKKIDEGLEFFGGNNIDIHDNIFLWNSVSMRLKGITYSKIWNNSIIGTEYTSILLGEGSDNNHVYNNIILRENDDHPFENDGINGAGITLYQSDNNTIELNHCSDIRSGISIRYSAGCEILDNKIYFNRSMSSDVNIIGISIEKSPYSLFEKNYMLNCGLLLSGEEEIDFSTIYLDETNKVDGNPIRMIKDEDKQIDLDGDYSQLILVNCSGIDIIDADQKTRGVFLTMASCEEINIRENKFSDLFGFLYMWGCKNITVKKNVFSDMIESVNIQNSTDLIIADNEFSNAYYGILGSFDNTLIANNNLK
ncbi:MAG: right-handed parallel beta-helix repeat-containing protein, partial [Thermoplasmatota archaeon]